MKIAVIGTGYVGLVTGACLADIGHEVTCVDIDDEKISRLNRGEVPIFETGLEQEVHHNVQAGRLRFTTEANAAVPDAAVVFIAVGTPAAANGTADLHYVFAAADTIAAQLKQYTVIVDKSTVPVGTARQVSHRIKQHYSGQFDVASCPEFLREGCAVDDFYAPDRIIIGVDNDKTSDVLLDVFKPVRGQKVVTTVESAELIKYASNAFLATSISFINNLAELCDRLGGGCQ
jgi:UDPglucose 6-dehydrogenase